MSEKQLDENRILRYVTGLLYFYGVMDFEGLYRAVVDNLPGSLEQDTFRAVLDKVVLNEDNPYELCFDRGFYFRTDVEDVDWVLEEQRARGAIPYRPVTEKEAHLVADKQYSSLWNLPGKKLFRLLQEKFDWSREKALEMILRCQDMHRHDVPSMEIVQRFMDDIEFRELDEVQPLINSLMELTNHTPLWILKGWTPHEVFERYEKPALRPLPATPFELKDREEKRVGRKVGRNEPCPCGSGKKFKKCCGAPAAEEKNVKLPPPAKREVPTVLGEPLMEPPTEQPTLAEWRALYEAAVAYKKAECWEWMYNEDLFGVMDPETGEIAYCCIMGFLGEFHALGAYLGADGLETALEMLSDSDDEGSPDNLFNQKCLIASFENRNDLANEDRVVIKELGLRFRGKNQWPLFRSYEPGLFPWFISAWECRFLTLVLQQALETALRCRAGKTILEHEGPRTFLVRVPREQGGKLKWVDQYLEAAQPVKEYVSVEITDELRLRKILSSRKKGQGIWEIDTFWVPFPVQEEKNARPYYPKIFLILDGSTGLILRYEAMKNIGEEGHLCIDAIIQLMDEGMIPSRIVVERDETYYLLVEACRQLNISLEKVAYLKLIPEIREKMLSGEQ